LFEFKKKNCDNLVNLFEDETPINDCSKIKFQPRVKSIFR
jgi:hypothetical protein